MISQDQCKATGEKKHPFAQFLEEWLPTLQRKAKQLNQASWILETTGSADAADLKGSLDVEVRLLFQDPKIYGKLLVWEREVEEPLLKRQLKNLVRAFRQNQLPTQLLEKMAQKEAALSQLYASFRPRFRGEAISENGIREVLKKERDPRVRREAWEASKEIGRVLAPHILELVHLRNEGAKSLGYENYFEMQLELQEVDPKELERIFDNLAERSDAAYGALVRQLEGRLSKRFQVAVSELGPWSWSEPFGQEDPLDSSELDQLTQGVDFLETAKRFYRGFGFDVAPVLERSDSFEREGKCQHAFCTDIDRSGDVRTLNNLRPTLKWLETLLHELGHAIYDLGCDPTLPWLLREPPHMITTEAMALLAGRQAYLKAPLKLLVGSSPEKEGLLQTVEESLARRQLIFSRWVLVMTSFERALYRDPSQDLNALWWREVERFQKIQAPARPPGAADWAAKYHIGLAPVYYFSYLLGELFASQIQKVLRERYQVSFLQKEEVGQFLRERLFAPGNRMPWDELVVYTVGEPLSSDAWIAEFAAPLAQKGEIG